jgi:aromatic ring-opening dioxygenase catalytic subunit (LigB family)
MGQIVAAMVSCHAPALFLRQPGEDPAQLDATITAMRQLGRVLDETKPDALIVVGLDHLEAFSLDVSPAFAVVVGPEVAGSFGSKQYRVNVHQTFARALLDGCLRRDFDIAFCHKAFMGHAFVVPFEFILEQRQIPIVPLFVNVYVPPLPQPHRAYQLGRCIAEIVAERGERVAILASGGMSHYPGTEKYGYPDFDFDRYLLGVMARGEQSSLLGLSSEQLDETGETELLTWYVLFGAIGNQHGQVLSYQPTWHHGLGVINFALATPLEGPPSVSPLPRPSGNSSVDYRYYKFPEPESYNLNRLLYDLRMNADERRRFVRDMDDMLAHYDLRPEEIAALKTLEPLTVAKAGAHPILAWTAVHLVAADIRAQELKSGAKSAPDS